MCSNDSHLMLLLFFSLSLSLIASKRRRGWGEGGGGVEQLLSLSYIGQLGDCIALDADIVLTQFLLNLLNALRYVLGLWNEENKSVSNWNVSMCVCRCVCLGVCVCVCVQKQLNACLITFRYFGGSYGGRTLGVVKLSVERCMNCVTY